MLRRFTERHVTRLADRVRQTFRRPGRARRAWDLTALLNAADPRAPLAERHLWLIRLLEWLRHAPLAVDAATTAVRAERRAAPKPADGPTSKPVLRLRHLLNLLDRHPEHRLRVAALLQVFWREADTTALFADFGFASRMAFLGELGGRIRERVLPRTPATKDLGELFGLLFPQKSDAEWLEAIDADTLSRLVALVAPTPGEQATWLEPLLDAIVVLGSEIRSGGYFGPLRQRMSPELMVDRPFRQLARVSESLADAAKAHEHATVLQDAHYLRALLDASRRCVASIHDHLEEHGVSIGIVFEMSQLAQRIERTEALLLCVLSPHPSREAARLVAGLVRTAHERRSIRELFAQHYSLLARKVTERSAETGEHYITRDRREYRAMLRAAAGGGAVLAGTTFAKFSILSLGLSAFWGGFFAGINYSTSFVIVQALHLTVATKQPAMTAHAMAERLEDVSTDAAVERFVDEVANLTRSQAAGVIGNLAMVVPMVLLVQYGWTQAFGHPLVGHAAAEHVLEAITLRGPTAFYAAFTGVLLFASSMIAGWVENWFVWHRLDSAIAWNPRIVDFLGATRAQRWSGKVRANVSGWASNISLGMMLGLVPAIASFFALPLDVRHVTLSTGQLAAAVGALGLDTLHTPAFWWCVAGIAVTGLLNVSVSFALAFTVALRSRGIRLGDRGRIYGAVRRRLWRRPLSFFVPPREKLRAA